MSNNTASLDAATPAESSLESPTSAPKRRVNRGVLGAILLVLIISAVAWYLHVRGTENTDDAQIDGHLVPIAARVDGTIEAVKTDDNQIVHAGQVLVQLDPKDFQVALDQAIAQYDQASAQLTAAGPNLPITQITNRSDVATGIAEVASAQAAVAAAKQDLAVSEARLKESQAVNDRAQADLQRYQTLFDKHEVSHSDYDQYKSAAAAQIETVTGNQASVAAAQQVVEQRQAELAQQQSKLQQSRSSGPLMVAIRSADIKSQRASAEAAQSVIEKAKLNLGYTQIVAPVGGVVTQRSAEPGARVSMGQQLMMIVQTDDLWVTANFKETQLAKMRPGQKAKVYVDALKKAFDGTVESMPAITGSRTSVLPPENATGNYVKVIQRMPVRIRLIPGQSNLDKLRPGMSVEPTVFVE